MGDNLKPEKHGRDHCPGGEDPTPCLGASWFRAARTSDITIAGASSIVVDWHEWESSSETVFTPLDATLNPADPGETVRRVELNRPGLYHFSFGAVPDTDIAGSTLLAMHDGDDTWGFPDGVLHGNFGGGLEPVFLTFQLSRIYPIFDPFGGTNDTPQISFTIAQSGGASEVYGPVVMEIHYLASDLVAVAS